MNNYGVLVYIKKSDKDNKEYFNEVFRKFIEEIKDCYGESFTVDDIYYEVSRDPNKLYNLFEDSDGNNSYEKCLVLSMSIGDRI